MEAIKTYDHKGYTIEIHYDEWGESPRNWDNFGTMACYHRRYTIGDEKQYEDPIALQEYLTTSEDMIYLPVYMYEHSGIALSTSPFGDRWDSGQIGFIYMTKEKAKEEGITEYEALDRLDREVKTMDDFVRGNVYGYKVFNDEGEELDSCWGYIGRIEDCEEAAEQVVDYYDRTLPKQYDLFCA